jgi:hypothetical protein
MPIDTGRLNELTTLSAYPISSRQDKEAVCIKRKSATYRPINIQDVHPLIDTGENTAYIYIYVCMSTKILLVNIRQIDMSISCAIDHQ